MTKSTRYFFEEKLADGWISCGYGSQWTLDQCREKAMERKARNPRAVLRIVRESRAVWRWSERSKAV